MSNHNSWMPAITKAFPYLTVLLACIILVVCEHDYLARVEEQNLFLHTPLFFKQCMVASGGMLCWISAFLTQMLYHPWLGAAVLGLLWALLIFLTEHAFRIPSQWRAVTLIPVAMLLVSDVDLGYWIYYLKLRGFFFTATVGVLAVVTLIWIYRALPRWWRMLLIPLTVAAGYPMLGFYALSAVLLMALMSWRVEKSKVMAAFSSLLAVLSIIAVPLLYYRYGYHQTNLVNIYWTALPIFRIRQESYLAYYWPYVVLFLSLAIMAACYSDSRQQPKKTRAWVQPAILLVIVSCVATAWYKDGNFHREIAMRRMVDQLDWEGVLRLARSTDAEPTRDIWMMKNLALARIGKQGDEMYDYRNGARPAAAPFPTRMVQWDGKMLYLQYGLPNYCYRWCMEDGVEYGWRVDHLKLMAKCSIVNEEFVAAQKYLNMLKRTLFHRKWALQQEELLHNPQLIPRDPELFPILGMLNHDNYLSGDNAQVERFLITHLASTQSKDPLQQEQGLIAAMMTRNPELFWLQFFHYTELHKDGLVPKLYQQAACLFGGLFDTVDASKMPFDRQVVESCRTFMDAFKQYRDQGMSMEQIGKLMYDRFHTTYYYDYFFNRYQEEVY